jgi:hypothetical protein
MALARIITRSEICSCELAFHLLGRGYSVEVVSPDSIPASKAELELRVETDSSGKLTANVVARDGERSASLDFVRETKMSTALPAISQALPNLPTTPEVVYLSGTPISKAMQAVATPGEAASKVDVTAAPVEILAGPVVKSVAERKAEQEEVATSAVTPSLAPLASEPSRLLSASSMIMESPVTHSSTAHNSITSPDHSPVAISRGTSVPAKPTSPVTAPATLTPSIVAQPALVSTPQPVAATTPLPSATSHPSLSVHQLRPKSSATLRFRRFGRMPSLVGTVAVTWAGMALLLTLAIGLSLRNNSALKGADKTAPSITGPATVTEEKKQAPAAPVKETERRSGPISPLSTAPAAKPEERKSDAPARIPSIKKVDLRENEIQRVLHAPTQDAKPRGHGESLIARDTVTYLNNQIKKTEPSKLSPSRTQSNGVVAENTVTPLNGASPLRSAAKPAK